MNHNAKPTLNAAKITVPFPVSTAHEEIPGQQVGFREGVWPTQAPSTQHYVEPAAAASANSLQDAKACDHRDAIRSTSLARVAIAPREAPEWTIPHLLTKKGVTLLVTPPGACCSALCTHLAASFIGTWTGLMGGTQNTVRYPGDVILTTHSPHLDRSLKALLVTPAGRHTALIVHTIRRFNWRTPMLHLAEVAAQRALGSLSALIVDCGGIPAGIDESIVEAAYVSLIELSEELDCQVILVVESTSRSSDPFERVPRSLRVLRGTLLVVPLRPQGLHSQFSPQPEFMLLRLAEAAATVFTARFSLEQVWDAVEAIRINWGPITYDDPRAAFSRAETAHLTAAQRAAAMVAYNIIREKGLTSSKELQAMGQIHGIAGTTMRDALTVAGLHGNLKRLRSADGRWYWGIPGVSSAFRF